MACCRVMENGRCVESWGEGLCCGVLESLSNLQSPPRYLRADKEQSFRGPWLITCSNKLPIYSNKRLVGVVADNVSGSGHGFLSVRFFAHPSTRNRLKMLHPTWIPSAQSPHTRHRRSVSKSFDRPSSAISSPQIPHLICSVEVISSSSQIVP